MAGVEAGEGGANLNLIDVGLDEAALGEDGRGGDGRGRDGGLRGHPAACTTVGGRATGEEGRVGGQLQVALRGRVTLTLMASLPVEELDLNP